MAKIFIASDHAGWDLKAELLKEIRELGHEPVDLGTYSKDSCDYPDYADALASKMLGNNQSMGVLVCGSGIGMSMAANRHRHIRAALCRSSLEAKLAKQHNAANVLCLGARISGIEVAKDCLNAFLEIPFEGGRHQTRIEKLS